MQDDLIHAHLTVGETLYYAAALRMSNTTTVDDREKRVAEVLKLMKVSYCKNVIVGDTRNKGISGGEVSSGGERQFFLRAMHLTHSTSNPSCRESAFAWRWSCSPSHLCSSSTNPLQAWTPPPLCP